MTGSTVSTIIAWRRYENKGMRIDHCLVTSDLQHRVASVEICGHGNSAGDPSFMGSDHCPMLIRLTD